jgi:hypothetical protein
MAFFNEKSHKNLQVQQAAGELYRFFHALLLCFTPAIETINNYMVYYRTLKTFKMKKAFLAA